MYFGSSNSISISEKPLRGLVFFIIFVISILKINVILTNGITNVSNKIRTNVIIKIITNVITYY